MKETWQIIENNDKYLQGDMTPEEKENFVSELKGNQALEETLFLQKILTNKISGMDDLLLNKNLNEIHRKHYGTSPGKFLYKLGYALIPIAIATLTWILVYRIDKLENPSATIVIKNKNLQKIIQPVLPPEKLMMEKKAAQAKASQKNLHDKSHYDTQFASNSNIDDDLKENKKLLEVIKPEKEKALNVETSLKNILDKTVYDTLYGTNLIINGDFTGLKSVSSEYKRNVIGYISEGEYEITDHSTKPNDYFYPAGDHTSGEGLMMALNGAKRPGTAVWMDLITVQQKTTYQFSIWIMNVQNRKVNIWNHTNPFFILKLNGVPIARYQLPEEEGKWFEFKCYWYSGENEQAAIKLWDKKLEKMGNDFCIDDISFREVKFSKKYIPKSVFFDYDEFQLKDSAFVEMDALISYLEENKEMKLDIRGFTDRSGEDPYNKKLSEKRAKTVADYIIEKGIAKSRLSFQGEGKDENINLSNEEKRRVQITILE